MLPSVNDTTKKLGPTTAVDQIGFSLQRIIHAFASTHPDEKIFLAKWDIKDCFWCLDCEDGEEYNFAYVLPAPPREPIQLVISTSLQMGWVESPVYFCTASETAQDVADTYTNTPFDTLLPH